MLTTLEYDVSKYHNSVQPIDPICVVTLCVRACRGKVIGCVSFSVCVCGGQKNLLFERTRHFQLHALTATKTVVRLLTVETCRRSSKATKITVI